MSYMLQRARRKILEVLEKKKGQMFEEINMFNWI
jgi:hypothetical protein